MKVDVIILAAGRGTRMRSQLPKVLHPLAGKSLLAHVIESARQLPDAKLHIVIGHEADQVKALDQSSDINWVMQTEQLGTGHAVKQALPGLRADATAIILYGDVPLIKASTLNTLLEKTKDGALGLLTARFEDPSGYGRIVRNASQAVEAIVEQKDARPEQLLISEVNTGFMAVASTYLERWLPELSNENAQGEYYLTDLIEMASNSGVAVNTCQPEDLNEVEGVNSRVQLIALERDYQRSIANQLLMDGVAIIDPNRFDLRGELQCGMDTQIDVNCVFEGSVSLGDNVRIGPNCVISNSTIGNNTVIKASSVLEGASVAEGCDVGPFARLRPGSELRVGAKVGNFVEMKKSILGEGSKINHLSYVGDSEIGKGSNVGAGTITCNYDGVNKHRTTLGDNVFVGSNSTLVAPINIATGGFVGAGSTVTKDVATDELAVSRAKQRNITGWVRPGKD